MALPNNILNGQVPSATPLMANFNYLDGLVSGGQAIKSDTYANLRTAAALAPTVAFLCIATDHSLFLLYCGDAAAGDLGVITLGSWVAGGIT